MLTYIQEASFQKPSASSLLPFPLADRLFVCQWAKFYHWQTKCLSVHAKCFRKSLHWQTKSLSINDFLFFFWIFLFVRYHWQTKCLSAVKCSNQAVRSILIFDRPFVCQWLDFCCFYNTLTDILSVNKAFYASLTDILSVNGRNSLPDRHFVCQWLHFHALTGFLSVSGQNWRHWQTFLSVNGRNLLLDRHFVCQRPHFHALTDFLSVSGLDCGHWQTFCLSADTNTHYLCKNTLARRDLLKQWIAETLVKLSWTSW